jgi:hypothetical protein
VNPIRFPFGDHPVMKAFKRPLSWIGILRSWVPSGFTVESVILGRC